MYRGPFGPEPGVASETLPGIIPVMALDETQAPRELVPGRTLPLLAGYWSFGQFWGYWVILVLEFQLDHAVSDSRLGGLSPLLSVVAIGHTGFVWSPPLLGWISDTIDLRAAMAALVLATLGITATGVVARREAAT